MPRLVRRRPLSERIKDYLNPLDLWMRITEELETSDYPWEQWAYAGGVFCNFAFMLARANSVHRVYDDVFADGEGQGFITAFAALTSYFLIAVSAGNAVYAFTRKRHYRLFEKSVEGAPPSTPSARRVRLNSPPVASSPLRLLSKLFLDETAEARAHADTKKDVWEVAVWDPLPVNLRLFCTFSPGHALLYWLFIPVSPTDPRPSTTVATAVFLAALLTVQLVLMQAQFSQQVKDTSYIQKEVMNEYETKYVHPRTQPVMRDVGVQFDEDNRLLNTIETYTPVTVVNKGFRPNPNPNYVGAVDPGNNLPETSQRSAWKPVATNAVQSPSGFTPQPRLRQSFGIGGMADEGYLGGYTHPRSPLKKKLAEPARRSTGTMGVGTRSGPSAMHSPRPSIIR